MTDNQDVSVRCFTGERALHGTVHNDIGPAKRATKRKFKKMTDNPMTAEECLKLAKYALDELHDTAIKHGEGEPDGSSEFQQAADILRNGTVKVENEEATFTYWCDNCNCPFTFCECGSCQNIGERTDTIKTYTTHQQIKIVPVQSEPVFRKVD